MRKEAALTHTPEKKNLIASNRGSSTATFASAEKETPWQYRTSQKLTATTLLQSGFIYTPEEVTTQINNDFTTA